MNEQTFQTTIQRKIKTSPEKAWQAWADAAQWSAWVQMNMSNDFSVGKRFSNGRGEGGEYLQIDHLKTIVFGWDMKRYKPGSIVTICFETCPDGTTVCRLTHSKLQTKSDLEDAETGWKWAMDSLQSFLENDKPLSWEEWAIKNQ